MPQWRGRRSRPYEHDAPVGSRARDPRRVSDGFSETRERPIVFLFSGQGSQYVDMARGLYGGEAVFRHYVDACCDLLAPTLGYDLRDVMFPPETHRELASARLTRTAVTQPALFTLLEDLLQMPVRPVLSPRGAVASLTASFPMGAPSRRAMDYAVIGGTPMLATRITIESGYAASFQRWMTPLMMVSLWTPTMELVTVIGRMLAGMKST